MMNSSLTGSEHYNLLVEKRKRLWLKLFTRFQNVSTSSDDIAITDLPKPINQARRKPNTSNANNINPNELLNSTNDEEMSDDLDDSNNENLDDTSENGSEDIAKFSDSEDENAFLHQSHAIVYETDSDEELSEDLDATNDDDSRDSIDVYFDEIRNSLIRCDNEDIDDENECSDDENPSENEDLNEPQRKRTFSESGLADDSFEEIPPVKKVNCQMKSVNVYINVSKSDFESDNE